MPAAAVIPAPIAYTKVVAVKKLVVECLGRFLGSARGHTAQVVGLFSVFRAPLPHGRDGFRDSLLGGLENSASFTVNKLECLKQALWLE